MNASFYDTNIAIAISETKVTSAKEMTKKMKSFKNT